MAYEQGWDGGRRYGDEENRYRDEHERGCRYRGEGYAPGSDDGNPAESARARRADYGRREREDRGFLERAGDEVRSWFGDDDAQRRRSRDEPRGTSWEREPVDREWARQWGYVDRSERGFRPEESRPERSTYEGGWRGVYGPTYGSGSGWARAGRPTSSAGGGMFTESYRDESVRGSAGSRESASWGGPYAGRGPRGYQRGDERIKDELCERMSRHGQLDASDIEVVVVNGEVTLQGHVNDRYAKRLAEDLAESVWGVREVHNQIRTSHAGFGDFGSPGQAPDQPRRVA